MFRLLHTSDWHLGHVLHGFSRASEHDNFLAWLGDILETEAVDTLLVTGDIFDASNPPTAALERYYRFLAKTIERMPDHFRIVVIGGNHDSPARLAAPSPILTSFRVHVIGGLTTGGEGRLETENLLIPLFDKRKKQAAWCAAMPFIRVADLPSCPDAEDPFVAGVRHRYGELTDAWRQRTTPDCALVVTGHCYLRNGKLTPDSERKVLGANRHALPHDVFPEEAAYVALGHLHLPQQLGRSGKLRYAGAPIPLSFSEADYRHAVYIVDLEGSDLVAVHEKRIPRTVPMVRLRAGSIEELPDLVSSLEPDTGLIREEEWPLLSLTVVAEAPDPDLRRRVNQMMEGRAAKLLNLEVVYENTHRPLATALPESRLDTLKPETVFAKRYRQRFEDEVSEELEKMFAELMTAVHEDRT